MGTILGLGLAFAGLVAATQVVMWIIVVSRLVKMPLRAPLLLPIQRSLVVDVLPVFDTVRPQLEQNGFQYMHTRRVRTLVAVAGMPPSYCDVYYNAEHDIHAEVYLASVPTPHKLCDIYLWNTFVDGSALLTVNNLMQTLIPYPSNIQIADGQALDLAGQVATHLKARAPIAVARTSAADALQIARTMAEQLLPKMEQEQVVYRRGHRGDEVVYGFRLVAAAKTAWRMRRAALQTKKKIHAPIAAAPALPDVGPARLIAERLAFARTLCTLRGLRAPRWFRHTVFVFSALGFLALGSWWWGPSGAAIIAAVILVHEAGHWLAMKLAGFRDVQVFFVPGMGGATSGEKHEAHPMTHLMVYLAGPVPGLLLAMAVFAWMALAPVHTDAAWHPLLLTGTIAMLFINALNMLPVLPLDGGRIVDLLLVGRLPWLRFGFAVVSGGALLLAGISNGDNVLRIIGIAMLFASRQHYRIAKASAQLLREKISPTSAVSDFAAAATQLHEFLCRPAFQKWPYPVKLSVGQALLPRFLGRIPSWKEIALGMAVYVFCALLPLLGLVGLVIVAPGSLGRAFSHQAASGDRQAAPAGQAAPVDQAQAQKAQRAQRAASLATAQTPAQRQTAYEDAIRDADENDDHEDQMRLARQNYAETGQLPAPARERAQAALLLADTLYSNDNTSAERSEYEALLVDAETILRQRISGNNDAQDVLLLTHALESRTPTSDAAARLAMRQEIVTLLTASAAPPNSALATARRSLARALDRVGQADAAEGALRAAIADTPGAPANNAFKQSLSNDLAWMLVAHRKFDEATQIATAQLAASANPVPGEQLNHDDAHWILLTTARIQGDWNLARRQAIAIRDAKPLGNALDGNWIAKLLFTAMPMPQHNRRATLMLIDAERALGHGAEADQLLADMRASAPAWEKRANEKNTCNMRVTDPLWRKEMQQALQDIEARELKCEVPKNAPMMAAE